MKKLIPIIALIPLVFLALTPPWIVRLDCSINGLFWLWMTFASGFLAFLFLYQKVSVWLRLLVVWCFVSAFISRAPFMSFTMYWSLIACAYYYVLCKQIEDFTSVKKAIQAIFFFIALLVIMQFFKLDTLLNFNTKTLQVIGTIGNPMISSSFMCILAPFLILTPLNWLPLFIMAFMTLSSGGVLSITTGFGVYSWFRFKRLRIVIIILAIIIPVILAYKTSKFIPAVIRAGRLPVYIDTIKLSLKHPQGYGIGTYKVLFPVLCNEKIKFEQHNGARWLETHNDWLQILFETGFPGFVLFFGWIISILKQVKDPMKLAGLVILCVNMGIHFPTRMCMSVLIILMFLAYCEKREVIYGRS